MQIRCLFNPRVLCPLSPLGLCPARSGPGGAVRRCWLCCRGVVLGVGARSARARGLQFAGFADCASRRHTALGPTHSAQPSAEPYQSGGVHMPRHGHSTRRGDTVDGRHLLALRFPHGGTALKHEHQPEYECKQRPEAGHKTHGQGERELLRVLARERELLVGEARDVEVDDDAREEHAEARGQALAVELGRTNGPRDGEDDENGP
mmetsp:Transcript_3923/g.11089  ORF Transcript_3923/g.11089 Transcript_3923/m.11089 type:complete len:206 (-) Transcript_3923:772-1389(-)